MPKTFIIKYHSFVINKKGYCECSRCGAIWDGSKERLSGRMICPNPHPSLLEMEKRRNK